MAWLQHTIFFFVTSLLLAPSLASICPDKCICSTTRDSLHRATCSSLPDLYKYTLRQKHHNINILDLSHNNITKITHELDRLTEVVTLDLSTNGLTDINKFLHNAKKLVHLNLAHNRIQSMSLAHLPTSISSLDLTNNLMRNVPFDVNHLTGLEHLELAGNPLECSCDNIVARDHLIANGVFIDHVKCAAPSNLKGKSWLELKTKELCKVPIIDMDMMMGDQPVDAVRIGEETTALRSMPLTANNDLEDGNIISDAGRTNNNDDDDSVQFMKVGGYASPSHAQEIEGSGEAESTTISDIIEPIEERKAFGNLMMNEEILPASNAKTTEDQIEGSGEGSGFGYIDTFSENDNAVITTTPVVDDFYPAPIPKVFENEDENSTAMEFPMHSPPTIYQGGSNWHDEVVTEAPVSTMRAVTLGATRDTTVSEQIRRTQVSEVLDHTSPTEENAPTHKTGTYVCIALIVVLLVGLIGFAIAKSQMRKRRDRRLLRHQKRDVEKASKEMVDMNKSLLGKPAVSEIPSDKVTNGKYELVPTHEVSQKKDKNGDLSNGNGRKYDESNGLRTDSPRDTNQNKNSSKDNNLAPDVLPPQETSFDSDVAPNSRKDTNTNSISSDEYFVPINDDDATRINGNLGLDTSQPLINGDQDYLSPSREYVPVYSPDMGRVRIKMTETPKPKTPVLVTRSRSNAGDIIITPSLDNNGLKSTT